MIGMTFANHEPGDAIPSWDWWRIRAREVLIAERVFHEAKWCDTTPEYTEGVCGDGAAILRDGVLMPIPKVLTALNEGARLRAEVTELRMSVVAFGGPWAAKYARDCGLPVGHLHPTHYDILTRAGARMDSFIRGEVLANVQ